MNRLSTNLPPISENIWHLKYQLKDDNGLPLDKSPQDTWRRVAHAISQAEKKSIRTTWEDKFYKAMENFEFIPAGRILAGAGTDRKVTLFNCYVMGNIEDDLSSIFDHVKSAAITLQQGGGIGQDFSTLRPKGALVKGVGADASGPINFMNIWDAMCRTMMSAGTRRGAMMATLRCDHPDIEEFITAKKDPAKLRMFNLSVLVTDKFMTAVKNSGQWPLVFNGKTYKTVNAKELWDQIMASNYEAAEPGVIFIDHINRSNLLNYCETIYSTNPCGEQPLPPYGACLLGSINLACLIQNPFESNARLNQKKLTSLVKTAIRFLDNTIDISRFPMKQQKQEAKNKRRIGLGITGLADALILCNVTYGSEQAQQLSARWMKCISETAFQASAELAKEKGSFPLFSQEAYLSTNAAEALPEKIRNKIKKYGLRNGLLTSIAPTGTISLFAGNVSSGIEPVFDLKYQRKILDQQGNTDTHTVEDYAHRLYREKYGQNAELTEHFVTTQDISPADHLAMQAAIQPYVDSAISKTINCPEDIPFDKFRDIYLQASDKGLKGCTTYRPNSITGSVLSTETNKKNQSPVLIPDQPAPTDAEIIYMAEPVKRDEILSGHTYKLRWPKSDHAIYVTINDIEFEGRKRPFEIFINSKNLEHYAWTVALTRMISAVFRRGGDIAFVSEELKAIFDPLGGQWLNSRYVPSLQAAIGDIIEKHMQNINFLGQNCSQNESPEGQKLISNVDTLKNPAGYCPACSSFSLVNQEGCSICYNCGKSECS